MREFTKQDQPLYRWKLTENKQIIKHTITNWDLVPWGMGYTSSMRYAFRIGNQLAISYLKREEIDVLVHNRYYSFENNDEKARELFLNRFIGKVTKAQEELDRYMEELEEFKRNNP